MGWKMGSFAGELAIGGLELAAGPPAAGTAARATSNQRDSETFLSVVIDCSSIYTGGVARLVAQKRWAKLPNRVFDSAGGTKLFFSQSFLNFCAARLGVQKRSAGGGRAEQGSKGVAGRGEGLHPSGDWAIVPGS
jgi:hypothetical protein